MKSPLPDIHQPLSSLRIPGGVAPAFLLGVCLMVLPSALHAGLFSPRGNSPEEKRQVVRQQRDEMLTQLYQTNPELKNRIAKAAGYATFKQTDLNLFLLSSGRGYGVLRDNKTGKDTFMSMASLGGGFGMGVKDLRVVFVFNDTNVMRQFMQSGWQFDGKGDASAKYKDKGLSAEQNVKANVDFKAGTVAAGSSTDARAGVGQSDQTSANVATGGPMEIYQFTESGVSLQATVAGTKYWKDSSLNQ
jgi:lipid-binding SYLF domain-containing protein